MTGGVTGRIQGLDGWRGALMLLGLALHATSFRAPLPLFAAIDFASTMFRMGSFFAISGMLAGIALSRRSPDRWIRRRAMQIGLPLLVGLALFSPLTTALLATLPVARDSRALSAFDWYHLWFLVALLLYCPLSVVLHRFDMRRGIDATLVRAANARGLRVAVLFGLPLVSLALMWAVMLVIWRVAPRGYWPTLSQARLIAGYAPLYALGFALGRSAALREALLAHKRLPAAILLTVALGYAIPALLPDILSAASRVAWIDLLTETGSALCPPAAALLIVRAAIAVRRVPPALHALACAAFTMYLVHYPLMIAMTVGFAHIDWHPYAEYAVALGVGGTAAYAFHVAVVERYPLAALLFNGVPLPPRGGAAQAA